MSNAFEQSLFVFFREDLHKLLKVSRPIVENISGSLASCVEEVTIDQVFQDALVRLTEVPGAVVAGSCLVFVRQDGGWKKANASSFPVMRVTKTMKYWC